MEIYSTLSLVFILGMASLIGFNVIRMINRANRRKKVNKLRLVVVKKVDKL